MAYKNKEDARAWRVNNAERVKAYRRAFYLEHSEEIKEKVRNWKKDNPEKAKKTYKNWRSKHLGRELQYTRDWRKKNSERHKANESSRYIKRKSISFQSQLQAFKKIGKELEGGAK